ncbi:hypothetical protein BC827DRAFT_1246480 [Russula dissimulans]|nr:hypothetical protein BC827DRAFT_1246480 [Russula dissimulans]
MDKATSVIAALKARKQPSQSQTNAWIEQLLQSELIQAEKTVGAGALSQNGVKIASDLRSILEAYKNYGSHKNGESLVQKAIWHLSQADITASSLEIDAAVDSKEALSDYRAIVRSLWTSLQIFWDNAATEGFGVFSDFASFTRLSLADVAEFISEKSDKAVEKLRNIEEEVQSGERDVVGIKGQTKEEWGKADVREAFEKSMDTVKVSGSAVIGAAQSDPTHRSSVRLHAAVSTMAKRAREDPEYRASLDTLFNVAHKWLKATGNAAATVAQTTSLESFVKDPTPERHLINAIRYINELVQNISGGKSPEDLYSALRNCAIDIRNDPDLRQWVEDYLAYARRALADVGDNLEEIGSTRQDLRRRWNELTDTDSNKSRKLKEDFVALQKEVREFQERMEQDKDLTAIRKAHSQLGHDIEETVVDIAAVGLQAAISDTSWVWTDLFNVYLPRFVRMLKSIPIPRTEYVNEKIEFVLEDLDISSIGLLPGHVFIRNITDIEITAPNNAESTTAVGTLTRLHVKGLQLKLSQLSFYYHDLTATVGPAEFTGLAEIRLPTEGIDVEVKVRTIPNTAAGLAERAERHRFLRIDQVVVNVSDDVDVRVTESNHPVLLAVFRPILMARLRNALQMALSANIRSALDGVDALTWDTLTRAEVFQDAGLARGPALAAAWWSELGRFRRRQGGLYFGWRMTGTGVVRNSGDVGVALGAEPQMLGPEKQGPKGTLAQPLEERAAHMDTRVSVERIEGAAKNVVGEARDKMRAGLSKVRTLEEMITEKQEEEEKISGWQSSAFDV